MNRFKFILSSALVVVMFVSCNETVEKKEVVIEQNQEKETELSITEQEVLDAQLVWGKGIVHIGQVYTDKGDYVEAARKHIEELYGYNMGKVLFKPTMAAEKQFRVSQEGALSYFIGHNENYSEDHGFAIKPWSNVRFENLGTKINGNMAICMGNYYFTPLGSDEEIKVEYTLGYSKDDEGKLKIILHGSHFPYHVEH